VLVSVSYSFAPAIECLKHAPVEPAVYEAALSENDVTGNDSLGSSEQPLDDERSLPEVQDKSLPDSLDDGQVPTQIRTPPRQTQRRTEPDVKPDGRPTLLTAPVIHPN
jgi:hypothetical protein